MVESTEKPFVEVLQAIFQDEPLPIHFLYRLSDMSPDEAAAFKTRWRSAPDEKRRVIVRHLADISEESFLVDFSPIFSDCFEDSYAQVRLAALDGIWDATDVRLIPVIIRLMQTDESTDVRSAAASALAHYVLMAEWGELPAKISLPIVTALLAEYERPETAISIKRAALEALGAANHPRVSGLIREAYESEDVAMQMSAVFAMGNSADEKWLPILLDEMQNPNAEMRVEAVRAAGSIGSSDAVPELAELTMDDELEVQLAAVAALGLIETESAQQILHNILQDQDQAPLHEAVEEALDEMGWMARELNFLDIDPDGLNDEIDFF